MLSLIRAILEGGGGSSSLPALKDFGEATQLHIAQEFLQIMRMGYERQYHESSVREEGILTASSVRANAGGMPIAMITFIARMLCSPFWKINMIPCP
mmetsp:Transcript_45896/g.96372  ORF Transcript_45896/g.96372 Transcript_45896/m.96372 type:complete len:97 (-) Transcript_45896:133-423(-)